MVTVVDVDVLDAVLSHAERHIPTVNLPYACADFISQDGKYQERRRLVDITFLLVL